VGGNAVNVPMLAGGVFTVSTAVALLPPPTPEQFSV
jgi:hypothetical protein